MNDGHLLVRELRLHPQDETLRLAYADWLEEHDEPDYAEYIRLWVVRGKATVGRRCSLWAGLCRKWATEVGLLEASHLHGVLVGVTLPTVQFLTHGRKFFAHHPLTTVWLCDSFPLLWWREGYGYSAYPDEVGPLLGWKRGALPRSLWKLVGTPEARLFPTATDAVNALHRAAVEWATSSLDLGDCLASSPASE